MAVGGGSLLFQTVVQLLLTAVPMVGAALVSIRLGVRHLSVLLAIALAASGLAAMLVFWAYYLVLSLGAASAWVGADRRCGRLGLGLAGRQAAAGAACGGSLVPFGLWALGSLFLIFFGFLHGGTEAALETGAARFSTNPSQLPSDNFIPYFFGDWIHAGHPGASPIFAPEWMFSDRPPLQIGYLLSQRTVRLGPDDPARAADLGPHPAALDPRALGAARARRALARRLKGLGDRRRPAQRRRDPQRLLRLAEAARRARWCWRRSPWSRRRTGTCCDASR